MLDCVSNNLKISGLEVISKKQRLLGYIKISKIWGVYEKKLRRRR